MALSPGARLGPYELVSLIGRGGMGEVYRARDPRLGRDVAIKVLPATLSADVDRLRRFEQEARATASLTHPNIVSVYDVGTHEGQPYVVSELLRGQTLRAMLAAGALSANMALRLATQFSRGLAVAHQRGIIHRDLKPENLFVTNEGTLKILDFGLAKLVERRPIPSNSSESTSGVQTTPGMILGTVSYMSPEQVLGQHIDVRSDVFSFGVVLYEMLTGQQAFKEENAIETLHAILKRDPPSFARKGDAVIGALDHIVRRCLQKRPERRFQSVQDIFTFRSVELVLADGSASEGAIEPLEPSLSVDVVGERDQQVWFAWWSGPVLGIGAIALLVGAAAFLVFWSQQWYTFSPSAQFTTVLSTLAALHLLALAFATRSPGSARAFHAMGTVALGVAIFLTAGIFNLEEAWSTGLLLWMSGAWAGWLLLDGGAQLAWVAILTPAWLVSEWVAISEHAVPASDRIRLPCAGLTLLALTYFLTPDDTRFGVRGRVLQWIGGLALGPAAWLFGRSLLPDTSKPFEWDAPLSIGWLLVGWSVAVGFPLAVAATLRKRAAWMTGVAAAWAIVAIQVPRVTDSLVALWVWFALGATALAASGVRESRTERINVGAAMVAIILVASYVSELGPDLDRVSTLTGSVVLLIVGVWLLEKIRRRLVLTAAGET